MTLGRGLVSIIQPFEPKTNAKQAIFSLRKDRTLAQTSFRSFSQQPGVEGASP